MPENFSSKEFPAATAFSSFLICFGGGEREEEFEAKRGGRGASDLEIEGGEVSEEGRRGGARRGWEGVVGGGGGS